VFDAVGPFDKPSIVIGVAMSLDAAKPVECRMKSRQHLSWNADISMLTSRHPDLVPLGSVLSFHRTRQPETSFSIHKPGGPRSLAIVGTRGRDACGGVRDVIVAAAAARSCFQATASIKVESFLESRGRLRSLEGTKLAPEQCDRGLGLLEAPRLPHIDPVFVRTDDLSHSQHRSSKATEDLRNLAVAALRSRRLHAKIATLLVREVGDRRTLAVEEPGGPSDLQRIERT